MKNNTKKQDIIEAYARVIKEQGIEGASMGAVAKELDIPQSLIFHYFINKEDLTNQLASWFFEACFASYRKAYPKKGEYNAQRYVAFVDYILNIHSNRRRTVSPEVYFALLYLMPRQARVRQAFIDLNDRVARELAAKIEEFYKAGVITAQDHIAAARTLIYMADGILCYGQMLEKDDLSDFAAEQLELYLDYTGFRRTER